MGAKMFKKEIKERISIEVIRTLVSRFENFPKSSDENRNAPFHEAFLEAFSDKIGETIEEVPYFISLSSWLHGLNTSLGSSFFENVSHILSDGEKRTFKNLKILRKQRSIISTIMTDLKNGLKKPNFKNENDQIFKVDKGKLENATEFTIDVYYEQDDFIEAIELKTVRPNSGIMKGEKQKILNAKAVLKRLNPDKNIYYYIGFPFDPFANSEYKYNKNRFKDKIIELNKYFDNNEILLSTELWDHLSEQKNTMQQIISIINKIATTDFLNYYNFIIDHKNYYKDKELYYNILNKWCLYREIEIIDNLKQIEKLCNKNNRLKRKLNQNILNNKNYYKTVRYNKLLSEISNKI